MAKVRVGIGGWTFAPWRGRFFPAGLPRAQELAYASARLTCLEINGTFYRHQTPETFAAWRDQTPGGFVFAVKAHRATTFSKDFAASAGHIERFLNAGLAKLGPKLGPILWQFPPARRFDPAACEDFLAALPKTLHGLRLRHAIEAQHASFADPAWVALLRRHKVASVMVERENQRMSTDVTAPFIYARLKMNSATAAEGYESAALDAWARRLRAWRDGGRPKDCFVFFIGGDKERAPDAAQAMMARLK